MTSASSRSSVPRELIDKAVAMWREARSVVVLTGAGISVPSGIPDFHSPGGLWTRYDPDEVASFGALRSRPEKVWGFLAEAAAIMARAEPNPAHLALARLERAGRVAGVITQNIDGLHLRAGSVNVVEFHGNVRRYYCMDCGVDHPPDRFADPGCGEPSWRCECGGVIRPDLVFYGEGIPRKARNEAALLAGGADLAVIVGTSGTVAPANLFPHQVKSGGGRILEINLGATAFETLSDLRLDCGAEWALPEIARALDAGEQARPGPGRAGRRVVQHILS